MASSNETSAALWAMADLATPMAVRVAATKCIADVAEEAPALVAAYDWEALGHVVDVGGGTGTLLIALLTAYPALRGTVLDLPGPVAMAQTASPVMRGSSAGRRPRRSGTP